MAFTVQDDSGAVPNANAYIDVDFFKGYIDDRQGSDAYGDYEDGQIERAIVVATDYVDNRFKYVGDRSLGSDVQTTQWPRDVAFDADGRQQNGIPDAVKKATAEYAMRALKATLDPDPVRDASGRKVMSESKSVGPVSKSVTYGIGSSEPPKYPAADRILQASGLIIGGPSAWGTGDLRRA